MSQSPPKRRVQASGANFATPTATHDSLPDARLSPIKWRLFELAPEVGISQIHEQLVARLQTRNRIRQTLHSQPSLSVDHLEKLIDYARARQQSQQTSGYTNDSLTMLLTVCLKDECRRAGRIDLADECDADLQKWMDSHSNLEQLVSFYLSLNDKRTANSLVEKLLPALRRNYESGVWVAAQARYQTRWWDNWSWGRPEFRVIDFVIAESCYRQTLQKTETVQMNRTHAVQHVTGGSVKRTALPLPYSDRLLDASIVRSIGLSSEIPEEIIAYLQRPLKNATMAETKTRLTLAAYAQRWNGQPKQCCESLGALAKKFPNDPQIHLEHARLLGETNQFQEALDVLKDIQLLNAQARIVHQVLTLHAAKMLSDKETARIAARNLIGMKLPTRVADQLVSDLTALKMPKELAQLLTRNATGKKMMMSTRIQMASTMQVDGDTDAAADIAFELFNECNRWIKTRNSSTPPNSFNSQSTQRLGRAHPANTRSDSEVQMVRIQAMQILKTTGRLQKLIETRKATLASAPASTGLRVELSQLYGSNDQIREAIDVLKASPVATEKIINEQVRLANSELSSQRRATAIELFLDAAAARPSTLQSTHASVMKAANEGKLMPQLKQKLLALPSADLPFEMASHLLLVASPTGEMLDDSERRFLNWLFEGRQASQRLFALSYLVKHQHRKQVPEIQKSVLLSLAGLECFDSQSEFWQETATSPWQQRRQNLMFFLDSVCSDDTIRASFEQRATELQREPEFAPMAKLLQALVKLWHDDLNRESDAAKLPSAQQLLVVLNEINQGSVTPGPPDKSSVRIDDSFLLQIASVINSSESLVEKDLLLRAVFDKCRLPDARALRQHEASYLPRYLEVLQAQQDHEKAIEILLKVHDVALTTPTPRPAPRSNMIIVGGANPLLTRWVTTRLVEFSAPAEAVMAGRAAVDQDRGIRVQASSIRSGTPSLLTLQGNTSLRVVNRPDRVIAQAENSLTEVAATDYLRRLVGRVQNNGARSLPRLLMQPVDQFCSPNQTPTFLGICQLAALSNNGRLQLLKLQDALDDLKTSTSETLLLAAHQFTIQCVLKSDKVQTLSRQLTRQIESMRTPSSAGARQSTPEQIRVSKTCLAILIAASQHAEATSQSVEQPLILAVCEQLRSTHGNSAALSAATTFGASAEAIDQCYKFFVEEINPSGMTLVRMLDQLKICQKDVREKQLRSAFNRLKILLSAETLEHVDQALFSKADLSKQFSKQDGWRKSRSSEDKAIVSLVQDIVSVAESVLSVASSASTDNGVPPGVSDKKAQEDIHQLLMDMLFNVIFVDDRSNDVNPYLKQLAPPIAQNTFGIHFTRDGLAELTSASGLLVRLAAEAEQLSELQSRIVGDTLNCQVLKIQVAHLQQDADRIATLLTQVEQKLDSFLPTVDAEIVESNSLVAGHAELSQVKESAVKSKAVNIILHCTWPVVTDSRYEASKADQLARQLLRRSIALIGSDQYTANRLNRIAKEIQKQIDPVEQENFVPTDQ